MYCKASTEFYSNRYSGGRKIITPAKFRQPTEVQRSRTTGSILKRKLPEPSNKIRTKIAKHCANVLVEQDSEDLEEDSEDPEDLMDSEENFETDCLYRLDSLEVEDVQEMTKKHNLVFGGPKKDMLKLTAKIIARRTFATKRQMLVRWFPVDCKESL